MTWRWLRELLNPELKCSRVGHVMTHERKMLRSRTMVFSECMRCGWTPVPNPVELDEREDPACIYCGCTEDRACLLPAKQGGGTCWWVSADPPVCSSAVCTVKARASGLEVHDFGRNPWDEFFA